MTTTWMGAAGRTSTPAVPAARTGAACAAKYWLRGNEMTITQRKIPPCSNLIVRIDLPRPKGGQQECTYHWLQCRQCVFDHNDHGVYDAFCPGCGRCFTQAPWGFAGPDPLIARPDYPTCGNCFWRLAVPCGCACGCTSPRLPPVVAFVLWVRAGMEENLIWLRLCARWP